MIFYIKEKKRNNTSFDFLVDILLDTLDKLKASFIDENRYNKFRDGFPALTGEIKIYSKMTDENKSLIIEENHTRRIAYINSGLSTNQH